MTQQDAEFATSGAFTERVMAARSGKPPDPDLIRILHSTLLPRQSVIDIGAGDGRHVRALRALGHDAWGVDGAENVEHVSDGLVLRCDLTDPAAHQFINAHRFRDQPAIGFTTAICIEVGEHIPEERMDAFLHNLASLAVGQLVISWARPGQRGRGHVSCRLPEWVAVQMDRRGWSLDHDTTNLMRRVAGRSGWASKILAFYPRST